jgi:hypothetical protein
MSITDSPFLFLASARKRVDNVNLNKIGEIISSNSVADKLPYISLNVLLSNEANGCKIRAAGDADNGAYVNLWIYDISGNVVYEITKSGQYFVDACACDRVSISNMLSVDNTASVSLRRLASRPSILDTRVNFVVYSETRTLSAGATEANFALNLPIMNLCKFIVLYVRYKGVSSQYKLVNIKTKTSFCNSTLYADIPKYGEEFSKENLYAMDTDWIPVKGQYCLNTINFPAAEEGDTIYFEIRGIR